jgi:PAS domain S-box-containing protein
MEWQYNPYIWLSVVAAVISVALGVYAWQRRALREARLFAISMGIATLWSLAYVLQLSSADMPSAYFWLALQMLGPVSIPLIWLIIVLEYTGRQRWIRAPFLAALLVIPAITLFLLYAGPIPGPMVRDVSLGYENALAVLHVTPGPWFWVHGIYSYLLVAMILAMLFDRARRLPARRRAQPLVLLLAVALLMVVHIVAAGGLLKLGPVNLATPLSAIVYGIFAWGIFRYRLLNIVPIARARVIEEMTDGLFVLDVQGRIVDMNPAAQAMLALPGAQTLGHPAAEVLRPWPALLTLSAQEAGETEWSQGQDATRRDYEASNSPLLGYKGERLGQLLMLRDVTRRKRAEEERQNLIAQLNTLTGLLPICAWCGKVRNEQGEWEDLARYIATHSQAEVTHGICPACLERLAQEFPGLQKPGSTP